MNESSSNISWIGTIQAFLLIFIGLITGPLFDYGYLRGLIITGSFGIVFGMMMTSICTEYWQVLLAQGILVGLGCGCLFVPSIAIIPQYFSTKKAFAQGIGASGSSLGEVIALKEFLCICLCVTRWCNLSYHVPQVGTAYWIRLDHTRHSICGSCDYGHSPGGNENASETICPSTAIWHYSMAWSSIYSFWDCRILWLHGSLHTIFLHFSICYRQPCCWERSGILFTGFTERWIFFWKNS